MGGEELKWRQLAHHQLMSQQGLVHTVQLKPMKAQISGRCSVYVYRISSNSFRGIYSFQVLLAAATKRGRLLNEGGYY